MSEMEDLKYEQQNQLLLTAEQEKLTLQSNVEELRENATTLTKLLEESKKESELLKEELSNKNEKLRVMEEQLKSEFHYREDASNSFVNELNKIKSDFEKEIESLKDEKDRLNLLIQEKDTSLDEFTNKIFSLTNDIKNLSTELSYRDEMDREKSSFIEKLTEEIATLKESHGVEKAKMETRISSLIDQLNDMESEVNRLQDLNKDANDKLNAHLLQTNDAMETINKAQVSLTEKESECQLLISEIKSLQVKNDELSLIIRVSWY